MNEIRDAILTGSPDDLAGLPVPESYRGVLVRADEQDMFEGLPAKEKDPRKSLHVEEVATPELEPGEGAPDPVEDRWPTSARPPTTCTETCTRGRSAC